MDLNAASAWDLSTLEGIGPATSNAIVEYRDSISTFFTVEELLFVPGIGQATLEAIRPFIAVHPPDVPESHPDYPRIEAPADTLLKVVFLDVGNGDATVVAAGDETWLIDGGPPGEGGVRAPVVRRLVECGIDTLSAVVFTHPHADHIGGCRDAMEVFHCRRLLDPGIQHASPVYEDLLSYCAEAGIAYEVIEPEQNWELADSVLVEVVLLERGAGSPNEASAVFLVTCGKLSLLLTGDIENESIMRITGDQQPVTVMKVPHHGSISSLFPPWFRKTMPLYAVFCCGRGNPFGHPHPDIVAAWEDTGAEILRTDANGNIFLFTDGESLTLTHSHNW